MIQGAVVDDAVSDADKQAIDSNALSRQLAVYDFKSQIRMSASSVLICGMGALG